MSKDWFGEKDSVMDFLEEGNIFSLDGVGYTVFRHKSGVFKEKLLQDGLDYETDKKETLNGKALVNGAFIWVSEDKRNMYCEYTMPTTENKICFVMRITGYWDMEVTGLLLQALMIMVSWELEKSYQKVRPSTVSEKLKFAKTYVPSFITVNKIREIRGKAFRWSTKMFGRRGNVFGVYLALLLLGKLGEAKSSHRYRSRVIKSAISQDPIATLNPEVVKLVLNIDLEPNMDNTTNKYDAIPAILTEVAFTELPLRYTKGINARKREFKMDSINRRVELQGYNCEWRMDEIHQERFDDLFAIMNDLAFVQDMDSAKGTEERYRHVQTIHNKLDELSRKHNDKYLENVSNMLDKIL